MAHLTPPENTMTYDELWHKLTPIYDDNEAKSIIKMVLGERFGMSTADILCGKVSELSKEDTLSLAEIIARLEHAEPVQYVLSTAYFAGKAFHVAPGVLIPRPETEDLCDWIISDIEKIDKDIGAIEQNVMVNSHHCQAVNCNILDIGCGSGCISNTLALNIPNAEITAWDISETAINIARYNATAMDTEVNVVRQDTLNPPHDSMKWDIIASNPPYVCFKEKTEMERNVLDYEPDIALFVPDDDPLLFYRAIADYASDALKPGGTLYFEANPLYVNGLFDLLKVRTFTNIETKTDRYGKTRFMKATI